MEIGDMHVGFFYDFIGSLHRAFAAAYRVTTHDIVFVAVIIVPALVTRFTLQTVPLQPSTCSGQYLSRRLPVFIQLIVYTGFTSIQGQTSFRIVRIAIGNLIARQIKAPDAVRLYHRH